MGKDTDLTGQVFGRWTVVSRAENSKDVRTRFLCRCSCGQMKVVQSCHLRSGRSKSCGCLSREVAAERNKKHGFSHTRLYNIWCGMRDRCYREKSTKYSDYGARGIKVCEEWNESFIAFKAWADENGYNDSLSIDRIDVNGNYCPENCRWATNKTQANNKRSNDILEYNGEMHTVSEWAEKIGISVNTLLSRIKRGQSIEKAISDPVLTHAERSKTDPAYKKRISDAASANKPNKRAVTMFSVDCEELSKFHSLAEAAKWIAENTRYKKADYATIRKAANAWPAYTAYGYRWKYE